MAALERLARPIIFSTAALLMVGASVTVLGLPLVGWTIYGVGYLGALLTFPAAVAVNRLHMDRLSWAAFGVLYVGIVLGVPVMAMVWGYYAQNPAVSDALMPYALLPIGMFAGLIAWAGLLLFGLATARSGALPLASSITFVFAAALGLDAELGFLPVWAWGLAIILVACGLGWIAATFGERRARTSPAPA